MHKKDTKQKAFPAMLALIRENWPSYLGAMVATVAIVIIGFITPLVLRKPLTSCWIRSPPPCRISSWPRLRSWADATSSGPICG